MIVLVSITYIIILENNPIEKEKEIVARTDISEISFLSKETGETISKIDITEFNKTLFSSKGYREGIVTYNVDLKNNKVNFIRLDKNENVILNTSIDEISADTINLMSININDAQNEFNILLTLDGEKSYIYKFKFE